jgi:hypothetical protein
MTKQLPLEESLALYNGVRVHGLDSLRLQQPARQAAEAEDSAPKKQTITQFADKIIGGNNLRKDSLLMGQRSFGDMLKAQNQMAHSL